MAYYGHLRQIVADHEDLEDLLVRCRICRIYFLTQPQNQGRHDLRCPFGCQVADTAQRSSARAVAYYQTKEGKGKKRDQNARRAMTAPPSPRSADRRGVMSEMARPCATATATSSTTTTVPTTAMVIGAQPASPPAVVSTKGDTTAFAVGNLMARTRAWIQRTWAAAASTTPPSSGAGATAAAAAASTLGHDVSRTVSPGSPPAPATVALAPATVAPAPATVAPAPATVAPARPLPPSPSATPERPSPWSRLVSYLSAVASVIEHRIVAADEIVAVLRQQGFDIGFWPPQTEPSKAQGPP